MAQSLAFPVSIEIVSDRKKMQAHLLASVRQHVGWPGSCGMARLTVCMVENSEQRGPVHLDLAVRTHLAN